MTVIREISVKSGEQLLVSVMAEPARYARLTETSTNQTRWLFDVIPSHTVSGVQYPQIEVVFNAPPAYANYYKAIAIAADGATRELRQTGRGFWDGRTVKELLVWELGKADIGYEIVDWGGYTVPDTDPA